MVEATGVKWDVYRLDTSHSPFLSAPKQLASIIMELAEKWTRD